MKDHSVRCRTFLWPCRWVKDFLQGLRKGSPNEPKVKQSEDGEHFKILVLLFISCLLSVWQSAACKTVSAGWSGTGDPLDPLLLLHPGWAQTGSFLDPKERKLNHLFPFLYSGRCPSAQGWSEYPTLALPGSALLLSETIMDGLTSPHQPTPQTQMALWSQERGWGVGGGCLFSLEEEISRFSQQLWFIHYKLFPQ